jgi:hypothetical protein
MTPQSFTIPLGLFFRSIYITHYTARKCHCPRRHSLMDDTCRSKTGHIWYIYYLFGRGFTMTPQSFTLPLGLFFRAYHRQTLTTRSIFLIVCSRHTTSTTYNTMTRFSLIGLLFLGCQMTNVVKGAGVYDLKITEIMINPSAATNTTTRWFELWNSGSNVVALNGIELAILGPGGSVYPILQTNHEIPANGYAVIGNNANRATNGNVKVDVVINNALERWLADGSGFNALAFASASTDSLVWNSKDANLKYLPISLGVSVIRTDNWNGKAQDATWEASKVFIHYGSSGDKGSPGRGNTLSAPPPPTQPPTKSPTKPPTKSPTKPPTKSPTKPPTKSPTKPPTKSPTRLPTKSPTHSPTKAPTRSPTKAPTRSPTRSPSRLPTNAPTNAPIKSPTKSPMRSPMLSPVAAPVVPLVDAPVDAPMSPPAFAPVDAPMIAPVLAPAVASATNSPVTTAPFNGLRKTSAPAVGNAPPVDRPVVLTTRAPLSLITAPVSAPAATPMNGKCRSKCRWGLRFQVHKMENGLCTKKCKVTVGKGWTCGPCP